MTKIKPFRWKLFVFDDYQLQEILGYEPLWALRLVSTTVKDGSKPDKDTTHFSVCCEDGYLVDIEGLRYVKDGEEFLRNRSNYACDYALLDWKDQEYRAGDGELMGLLLGIELRDRNRDASIVITSAFSDEVRTKFEPQWVRRILQRDFRRTWDIIDDPSLDKQKVLEHEWFRKQEKEKAIEVTKAPENEQARSNLIQNMAALPALLRQLVSDEVLTAKAEYQRLREALVSNGQQVDALDESILGNALLNRCYAGVWRLLTDGDERFLPGYLFPFHFSQILRQLDGPLKVCVSKMDGLKHSDVKPLEDFCSDVCATLSCIGCSGVVFALEVASNKVKYGKGREGEEVAGLHPQRWQQIKTLEREFLPRLKFLRENEYKHLEDVGMIWKVATKFYTHTVARIAKDGDARIARGDDLATTGYEREACMSINRESHGIFRWNPFIEITEALGLRPRRPELPVSTQKGSNLHIQLVRDLDEDDVFAALLIKPTEPGSLFLYGIQEHVRELFKTLAFMKGSESVSGYSEIVFPPVGPDGDFHTASGRIELRYRKRFDEDVLSDLRANQGDFYKCLRELSSYFSVSVGSEDQIVFLDLLGKVVGLESGNQTVIDLRFNIDETAYTGRLGGVTDFALGGTEE